MAKKRRVARQKYMDRIREVDQQRREEIKRAQEKGELKRLKKRGEIELAKRGRGEDPTPIDKISDPNDPKNQISEETQQIQRRQIVSSDSRNKVKSMFVAKKQQENNENNNKNVANSSSGDDVGRGQTGRAVNPMKMRRVEED
jgi:hypothetical protein